MCNHDYFDLADEDFGPLFIKFASYFPYTARVCLNGHEYLKRQLAKEGIAFEALDNGVLSCADPVRLQDIADGLNASKIAALVDKWLKRLPDPFTAADHAAGFNAKLSIRQAAFSRTQAFDRPLSGRRLFEAIIRDNIDLGRPSKVSLIFERRINNRTPGTFHKEGRALRTETTIDNTHDFRVGRNLTNLPALRAIGLHANRRLLEVETLSQDCILAEGLERIPHSHSYRVTNLGIRVALFFTKVHSRILRPGLSQLFDGCPKAPNRPVATAMRRLDQALGDLFDQAKLDKHLADPACGPTVQVGIVPIRRPERRSRQ
jgi:hypothetical protein